MRDKSAFILMTFAVIAVVLFVTLFAEVMEQMEVLRTYANISTFTAFGTMVEVGPTILLIGGIFAASFAYYKGYAGAKAQDSSGILRMVYGVVQMVLFVALFYTILTSCYTLYLGGATANVDFSPEEYTAFQTVVQIAPAVLFITGLFGGAATAVSGYRTRRGVRRAMLR